MREFSKKTGDYPSLSAVDIQVMALVYQLEKEHVGTDHIRTAPERKVMMRLYLEVNMFTSQNEILLSFAFK